MNCPNCQKENPAESRFCQYCGTTLSSSVTAVSAPSSPSPPAARPASQPQIYRPTPASAPIGQVGSGGTSAANIWGPFAGYGTRGRHVSWLLDNMGHKAEALHNSVTARFDQRQIPSADIGQTTLTAKGLLVEKRPFYFVKRGITTVALYIARFGQDLYISQVTYVKGPFSNFRIGVLAVMLFFYIYFVTAYSSALLDGFYSFNPFGSGGSLPFFLLCVIGPLGTINSFLLGLGFFYSIYKWIREKDFLAILRTPPNEFQQDDAIALEKAVEETVRQSLDKIGINAAMMPPSSERSFGQRRLI